MKRYFYNVNTFATVTEAIAYNRENDFGRKQVNVVPVFEIMDETNMESFDRELVTDMFGNCFFATEEEAQEAMNQTVAESFELY